MAISFITIVFGTIIIIIAYYGTIVAPLIWNTTVISARVIIITNYRGVFTTVFYITFSNCTRSRRTENIIITTTMIRGTTIDGAFAVVITVNRGIYTFTSR
jgi:hypothetical protein